MRARLSVRLLRHSARQSDLQFVLSPRPPLPRVHCPSHSTSIRAQAVRLGLSSPLPGADAEDPLIEFLERNQEDAALMLAMWTSLRRCCLHASEISESLSLGARWFLHHLIHCRAIAAAVDFYHRLVELGVQLQRWDVSVLLSNLPYEHSAPADPTQWTDRASTSKPPRFRPSRSGTNSGTSRGDAEDRAARERLRRWALYEASMGNVDLRSEDSGPASSTSCVRGALRAQLRHLSLLDEAAPREMHTSRRLFARRRRYAAEALRVVLRCLRAEDARGVALAPTDCALYFRLAADTQPWRRRADVEWFVARAVAPRLSDDAAGPLAAHAIWRAHLCRVRASRPRDYDRLAHACGAAAALPAAVRAAASLAKIAVSHLRVEIARDAARRRAAASTAASVRAGAFADETCAAPRGVGAGEAERAEKALGVSRRDAFVLVCVAVRRVVPLAAAAAAASRADAVALQTLLADALLGRTGLCALFAEAFADDAVAQAALAHCLVRCAAGLCETARAAPFGAGGSARAARHLVCAAAQALAPGPAAASCAFPAEYACAAERAAQRAAVSIPRAGLSDRDAAAANAALALVCVRLRSCSLRGGGCGRGSATAKRNRRARVAGTRVRLRASVLRPGGRALTPAAREALPEPQSRAEVAAFLRAGSRRGRQRRRRCPQTAARGDGADEGGGPRFFSPEQAQRIDMTGDLRQSVHAAALRAGGDDAALRKELATLIDALPAEGAALVPLVARHGAGIRPSAIRVDLYAAALCRVKRWDDAAALLRDAALHAETTERDVLTALLLPVLRASVRSGEADAGRALLRHWEALHKLNERDTQWEALHIRAMAALRDGRALAMCVRYITARRRRSPAETNATTTEVDTMPCNTDEQEALLCEVALAHPDWRQAFDAIVRVCGSPPAPYSPRVASAAMRLLCRAPRNLSATALRVRAGQGAAWDVANASRLVLLLARQRRWESALAHVAETLPALDRPDPDGAPRERAALLLHGLRACAIGGRGDDAAALYDRMKALAAARAAVPPEPPRRAAQMEALVDALLDPAESPADTEGDDLRPLVAQARVYFIRAMTKKTMRVGSHRTDATTPGLRGGAEH